MRQYEIWLAELPKPAGKRPVLLLSRADAYGFLNKFIAAEITAKVGKVKRALGYALGWEELIEV